MNKFIEVNRRDFTGSGYTNIYKTIISTDTIISINAKSERRNLEYWGSKNEITFCTIFLTNDSFLEVCHSYEELKRMLIK